MIFSVPSGRPATLLERLMRTVLHSTLLLIVLAGCGERTPGTVVGDAFLAEELGKEVNLVGVPVRLVEDWPELDSTLARACRPAPASAAAREQAWGVRAGILNERVRAMVVANPQAQFAIDSVKPGRYRLWADTTIGDRRWTWLQPINVRPGDTVRLNLTNANTDENPFRCRA